MIPVTTYRKRKNFAAVASVAAAISFSGTPRTSAIFSATIRAIGFDHEGILRDPSNDIPHNLRIFKCDDPGEGNKVPEIEDFARLLRQISETMEDPTQFSGVGGQDLERIIPGISLVDDDVEPELCRQIKLGGERFGLGSLVGTINDDCLGILCHLSLQRTDRRR